MYGEKLQLITLRCPCCLKWVALRVDPEDVERHRKDGVYVQDAFVERAGKPYLSASERELFLTVCSGCWDLLCPSSPLAYS